MKKHLLYSMALTAMMSASVATSAWAAEDEEELKLVGVYTLGEVLDEGAPADKITKMEKYFFDEKGNLMRSGKYATGTGTEFTLTEMTAYTYTPDDEGGVQRTSESFQWGVYDFGDSGFKKTSATSATLFGANGEMLKDVTTSYTYEYSYTDGKLTKETKYITSSGALSEEIVYTYNSKGQLQQAISTDKNGKFKLKTVYVYDAQGHKTEAVQYKRPSGMENDESAEYAYIVETWTYTDGKLTEYLKKSGGSTTKEPKQSSKKTYEMFNNNPYQTKVTTYSYTASLDKWTKGGLPIVEVYAPFSKEINEMAYVNVKTQLDAENHAVKIMFEVPALLQMRERAKIEIYRDGHLLSTKTLQECNIGEDNMVTVTDEGVREGTHTYYIVPVIGIAPELIEDESEVYWVSTCISEQSEISVDYSLAAATNLRMVGAHKEDYVQEGVAMTSKYITLEWDAPAVTEAMGFISNEVYFWNVIGTTDYFIVKDKFTDNGVHQSVVSFDPNRDAMDFIVVTHYAYGNVKSERLTVTKAQVNEAITGIESTAAAQTPATITGIYTMDGRKVTAPMNQLGAGTYIVVSQQDGVRTARKMVK